MAQRKKTQLGGKKCSKFTHKISKQSTGFTLLFFLTRLENRYSCKYILHCGSLIWFRTAFTLFNSGKQFLMITSKPFKTVISNGLEQIPFLVRTISDCSFGLPSLSCNLARVVFSHTDVNWIQTRPGWESRRSLDYSDPWH